MSQVTNPYQDQPFEEYYDTPTPDGKLVHEWGKRTVDGLEEIVHLPTGKSNMTYYKPETVLSPGNCSHDFLITSVGKREAECKKCQIPASFTPGISFRETPKGMFILFHKKEYPASL